MFSIKGQEIMIILKKNVLGLIRSICWFLITIILFIPCFQVYGANDWPSNEEFEALGYNVHTYFDPVPGTISSDLNIVKGIISINGEFKGDEFAIIIRSYGTIYRNETIFSNEYIGIRYIILNSSIKSYTEEILIETPSSGQFIVYIEMYFAWTEEKGGIILGNKTITLVADYQKLGFDLANIIIPGVIFLFCISLIIISVFSYKKVHKGKDIDTTEINQRLDQINIMSKQYFTRAGDFKDLDLSSKNLLNQPGQLSLLEHRKQELERKLKNLKPRQEELDKIAKSLEDARNPILYNEFFKFISSNFIHASRKRENYPPIDNVEDKVLELRNSLREGRWDELQDLEKVKLAWKICESYKREANDEELLLMNDLDVDKEAKTLVNHIKSYIQIEANTRWPPDRNLILKTIEELKIELEINDGLINKLRKSGKKSLKKYLKKCENLKKEAENNLKWLKSRENEIETDIVSRNSIRLDKLIKMLDNELNLLS